MRDEAAPAPIPWLVALVFGPLCIAAGVAILAAATGRVPVSPSPEPLADWWLWAGGAFFVGGGVWLLLVRLSPLVAMPFGLVALLVFVWVFNWVAFGSGPRHFSTSTSVSGVVVERSNASESEGRLIFGIGAALMDLWLAYVAVRAVRMRLGTPVRPESS